MKHFLPKEEASAVKENSVYVLLVLVAAELFMSFSFLGYVHIEPISVTFVYIPVLVAGCVLGPKDAMIVGAVFGLASMWKASAYYVGAGDAIFSPVMSGKPLASILLSVGSRTLFGLIVGLLFYWAKRRCHPLPWILAVASVGRPIHTVLVYGVMEILFPEAGFGLSNIMADFMRGDFFPFIVIADGIVASCYLLSRSYYIQTLLNRVREVDRIHPMQLPNKRGRLAVLLLVLLSAFSVAIYFTNRIENVMRQYQINLSEEISYDLMHLQIQFLMGILSLSLLVILIILLYQKNADYLYYEAKLDGLTGLLSRQQFFQEGTALLKSMKNQWDPSRVNGCFMILDVDSFKGINDTYGHPAGDWILREVARNMQEVFAGRNLFGRLGGDEFVALILEPVTRSDMNQALEQMKARLKESTYQDLMVTCSIGVIPVEQDVTLDELYRDADRLLYEAKKNGKGQVAFGYRWDHYEAEP